jgi:hypothetical protein
MATTTNYSWTTPDDTALVKDGAAAIRSLGTAIDSTVFTNAGAAVAKATVDAKGDLIAGTADNTIARLAVGANDTVLTADSSTATGLKWATPAGGPTGYTLLNSGGTSLSGSITTVSFSAQKKLWIYFVDASDSAAGAQISVRFNGDTGATNHIYLAGAIVGNPSWSATNVKNQNGSAGATGADLCYLTDSAAGTALGSITMDLADTTGWKTFNFFGAPAGTGDEHWQMHGSGLYKASAAITSVSLYGNNFDAGTMFVYGAN